MQEVIIATRVQLFTTASMPLFVQKLYTIDIFEIGIRSPDNSVIGLRRCKDNAICKWQAEAGPKPRCVQSYGRIKVNNTSFAHRGNGNNRASFPSLLEYTFKTSRRQIEGTTSLPVGIYSFSTLLIGKITVFTPAIRDNWRRPLPACPRL